MDIWFVIKSKEGAYYGQQIAFSSMVGKKLAPLTVASIDGTEVQVSDVRNPFILEIFATWCDICQQEVPTLNRLTATRHANILAIASGSRGMDGGPENLADLRKFKTKFGVHYSLAIDTSSKIAKSLFVSAVPAIVIVRANHIISYVTAGRASFSDLADRIH